MKRHFTRDKDKTTHDLGHSEAALIGVIEEILTELEWGGKFEFKDTSFTVITKCFGCIDTTKFIGTKEEVAFFNELVQHRGQTLLFLLSKMGIVRENQMFSRDDVIAAYGLFLEGATTEDLDSMIVGEPITDKEIDIKKLVDTVKEIKNNPLLNELDKDDGAHCIANSFLRIPIGSLGNEPNANGAIYPEYTGIHPMKVCINDKPTVVDLKTAEINVAPRICGGNIISFDIIED